MILAPIMVFLLTFSSSLWTRLNASHGCIFYSNGFSTLLSLQDYPRIAIPPFTQQVFAPRLRKHLGVVFVISPTCVERSDLAFGLITDSYPKTMDPYRHTPKPNYGI